MSINVVKFILLPLYKFCLLILYLDSLCTNIVKNTIYAMNEMQIQYFCFG